MKDFQEIKKFIQTRAASEKLVLCTLVRKQGSSYRGVGAKKIVALSGESYGMLSGGCLEASIEKFACESYEQLPLIQTFNTLAEEDRLLGYQTGCQGVIEILFERVNDHKDLNLLLPYGRSRIANGVQVSLSPGELGLREYGNHSHHAESVFEEWVEPVQLFVIGCGADALPFIPLANSMGWNLKLLDYRKDLVDRLQTPAAECVPLGELAQKIPQGHNVAAILMTHNYEADLEVLRGLKNHRLGYLGCLGPAVRYEKLKLDLLKFHGEMVGLALDQIARAPAGLFSHSRSPEEIALSIFAQIQNELIEERKSKAWTLILAAGGSSRYGSPKALASWNDQTFLERAIHTAHIFSEKNILVVTGAHVEVLQPYLRGLQHVHNEHWINGIGSSIACGVLKIRELDPNVDHIAILPVDQPFVSPFHLQQLLALSRRSQRSAFTSQDKNFGPPAIIAKSHFDLASRLRGEQGLKSVLSLGDVVCIESPQALADIDAPSEMLL